VRTCPDATFFHLSGWQQVIEESFGIKTWFYYVRAGRPDPGRAAAGRDQEPPVRPFAGRDAVLRLRRRGRSVPRRCRARDAGQAAHALARSWASATSNTAACSAPTRTIRPGTRRSCTSPSARRSGDDEANLNAIPRKQRAMVRKGIKLGLRGVVEDNVDRMFEAYAHSVHRLGTPVFPKKYFALLQGRPSATSAKCAPSSPRTNWWDRCCRSTGATRSCPTTAAAWTRARSGRQRLHVLEPDAGRRRARLPPVRLRPQQAGHRRLRLQEELGLHGPARCPTSTSCTARPPCRTTIR
jgi:hypothetical protein